MIAAEVAAKRSGSISAGAGSVSHALGSLGGTSMTGDDENEIRLAIENHVPVTQSDVKLLLSSLESARSWAKRWKSYAQSRAIVDRAVEAFNEGTIEDNWTLSEKLKEMSELLAASAADQVEAEVRGARWALEAVAGKLGSITRAGRCIDDALSLNAEETCSVARSRMGALGKSTEP